MIAGWSKRIGVRVAVSHALVLIGAMIIFLAGTAAVLFWQMRAQLQHFAIQDVETVEGLMSFSRDGTLQVREDYHNHPESKRVLERFLEVLALDGTVLYRNARLGSTTLGGVPAPEEGVGGYSARAGRLSNGTPVTIVSRRHEVDGRPTVIRLAYSEEGIRHSVAELIGAAALFLPIMAGAAIALGYRMSRTVLDPLARMTREAEHITSSNLQQRLRLQGGGDEIDQLAAVFNRTLERLERSFQELRQFSGDASHELRTPLSAIRTMGEVGLQHDGSREEYRTMVGNILEEVDRLSQLLDQLLLLSQADAEVVALQRAPVSLPDLAREVIALFEPLADEKEQRVTLQVDADIRAELDSVFIRQAVCNVLHNAIKYGPRESEILVRVGDGAAGASIAVSDSGPGISPEHVDRIFDRFYRCDRGRSRDHGGSGLGLAIAQWAVRIHGGSISVESEPGKGSTFRITLPLQPA